MNRRFLECYDTELRHLRRLSGEFAAYRPQTAKQLGLDPDGRQLCKDPFVERLLEGFAFLSARVHYQLDSEFPRFTQGLLETVYPDYLAPLPSAGVVRLGPDLTKNFVATTIEKGSEVTSEPLNSGGTRCRFRTAQDVQLLPIQISGVHYQIGNYDLRIKHEAVLNVSLQIANSAQSWSQLECGSLPFFLPGSDNAPIRLLANLMTKASGFEIRGKGADGEEIVKTFSAESIRNMGFLENESLLPANKRTFVGYRLLREYFLHPKKFHFFALEGIASALQQMDCQEINIAIGFKTSDSAMRDLGQESLELFCTPVVNLFEHSRRLDFDSRKSEHQVIMDRTKSHDYEVYSIKQVTGHGLKSGDSVTFRPFYLNQGDGSSEKSFFTLKREPFPNISAKAARRGKSAIAHRGYLGSEVYVSLVDSKASPYKPDIRQLGIEALCTNRHMALQMIEGGLPKFSYPDSDLIDKVEFLSGPTPPSPSYAEGKESWQLISHLSLNYQSLMSGGEEGAAAVRELLALYSDKDRPEIQAVRGVEAKDTQALHRFRKGPPAFIRGLEIALSFDENLMDRHEIVLFSRVLEEFFARYAAINTFTKTVVTTIPRHEEVVSWPKRMGEAQLL